MPARQPVAQALLEERHRHQQPHRRVRATLLVSDQRGQARLGQALGDLSQEDRVPSGRSLQLLLVTLARKPFDVAKDGGVAAVGVVRQV